MHKTIEKHLKKVYKYTVYTFCGRYMIKNHNKGCIFFHILVK